MDIIGLLEQYWGVTIIGGFTVGMLITLIWCIIKYVPKILKSFKKTESIGNTMEKIVDRVDTSMSEQSKQLIELEQARIKDNQHYQKVVDVMFKTLTYLAMSSKLDNDDKIKLVEAMKDINKEVDQPIKVEEPVVEQVKEEVKEEPIEELAETILDKYSK